MTIGGYILFGILVLLVLVILANFKKIGPFFQKLKGFFGEVSNEMRKVSWPTRNDVINKTILVGVVVAILTAALWVVDLVIGQAVRLIF